MNAWGWALIHFLWQGALIALALSVALRVCRSRGPEVRYALACAALALMALAPPVTALVLAGAGAGNAAVWVNDKGSRTSETLLALPEPGASLPMDWLVALWASGAAALLLRACGGWYVARRRTLTGIPLDYPLSRLMERMEMTGVVELMQSAAARTPQVFGWLRPVIVVPAATLARLSPAEFEAVLAHELAHIWRRDYLVNLVQTVVESVLFYHPAVWWVSRRIREERELCCDDWAVRVCGDRVAYSKALMKVEEETPMLAMAASATGLKARIARLLGVESDVKWRWSAPMAPVAAAVLALMLMGGPWWAMAWQAAPPPPPPLAPAALDPPAPPPAPPADVDQEQPPPAPPAPPPPPPRLDEGVLTEDVRRDVERTLAELRQNKGKIQEELRRAVEQLRSELSKLDTEAAKSALERAVRDLQRQEIHLESQEAMVMQALQRAVERSRQVSDDLEGRRRERARRTELASEKFSKAGVSGAETDRGRLYIRLGPPDEIESRPGPPDQFEIWRYHDFGGTGGTMAFRFEGPDYRLKSQARQ